jgi:hypothetical protein
MWYEQNFQGLIFEKDTLFYVLSTYFEKKNNVPLIEKYTFLISWVTNQENHDHGALPNDLGYTLLSPKHEFKFSFLLKSMFKLFFT